MPPFARLLRLHVRPSLRRCVQLALLPAATAGLGAAPSAAPAPTVQSTPRTGGPRLEIAAPVHDFGSVPQGEAVRHDFKLRNTGDAPLEIVDVKPACGCTTAGEWTRTIPPGATGTIPIQLETAQFASGVTKTVTVSTNDPAHPQTVLEIKADVWTPVKISQPVVIFPALTEPAQIISRAVTIRNQVAGELKVSDVRCDKAVFAATLKETVPGREFELTLTTVPPIANGTHTARITMKSSNPRMPELTVQAVATLLPPVQVAPTEIMLPAGKLAAPEKRYVVVLNHRGYDLQVSDVRVDAAGAGFSLNASPDKKQFTIMVTFPPGFQADAPGQRFVRGKTNHPEQPSFEVPIVGTGHR
ncbi:MAG: DUF1573 domain-containing protein [Verrucomicrobia bacterium]|nr:DUF1573 domain-containing protein [Verrucomicrobiota bacterium]